MAFEDIQSPRSILAGTSFAALQFTFVKLNGSGQLVSSAIGGNSIGVIQDKPAVGDPGSVCRPGDITKVQCSGTLVAGGNVSSDASGKAIPSVTGDYILGQALTAAVNGQVASVLFQPVGSKM
jgi:hypothetical protein